MTLDSIRYSMVDAILREPGNPLHRYALADSYEEVGDGDGHAIDDLRNDAGMWVIVWWGRCYRMLWVGRCRVVDLLPSTYRDDGSALAPSINVAKLPKAMVPECHTNNAVLAHDLPVNKCARDGRCRPMRRVASRHSGWRWFCPGGYARIGAPCVYGVYLA